MIAQNSEVYNPPTYLFSLYTYMEKDLCRGVVYFTVLCDHPCLVSLLFAVLVSLHPVTFPNVFYYLLIYKTVSVQKRACLLYHAGLHTEVVLL